MNHFGEEWLKSNGSLMVEEVEAYLKGYTDQTARLNELPDFTETFNGYLDEGLE